jgi:hypothetical protein
MGHIPLEPLPGQCPGPAGNLGYPQTSCLTRKNTIVTALYAFLFILHAYLYSHLVLKLYMCNVGLQDLMYNLYWCI